MLAGSGGKSGPKALHNATAYGSAAEASQAYVIASKTVGSCAVAGFLDRIRALDQQGWQSRHSGSWSWRSDGQAEAGS